MKSVNNRFRGKMNDKILTNYLIESRVVKNSDMDSMIEEFHDLKENCT